MFTGRRALSLLLNYLSPLLPSSAPPFPSPASLILLSNTYCCVSYLVLALPRYEHRYIYKYDFIGRWGGGRTAHRDVDVRESAGGGLLPRPQMGESIISVICVEKVVHENLQIPEQSLLDQCYLCGESG